MCSNCDQPADGGRLKLKQQQYSTVNTLEAQAQYDAAMSLHTNAISQRAKKKNREIQERKKNYR